MSDREIKFRAWDGKNMLSWDDITDDYMGMYDYFIPTSNSYSVMQYTGLKDKNGTEIYEGDVVEVQKFRSCITGVVEWDVFRWNIKGGHYLGFDCATCVFSEDAICKVIGNIYENPALVTKSGQ